MDMHKNTKTGCYSLRTLPVSEMYWGNGRSDGYRSDQYLYIAGKRVVLWNLAEVVYSALLKEGHPAPTPSIKFRPLLSSQFDKLGDLLQSFKGPADSKPCHSLLTFVPHARADEPWPENGMWASKWMADRDTRPSEVCVYALSACQFAVTYNVFRYLRSRTSMMRRLRTRRRSSWKNCPSPS